MFLFAVLMKEMHAEKNAAELLHEEKEEKLKLERRKERKRRKKERKKADKEAVEGCNSNNISGHKKPQFNNNKEGVKNNEKTRRDKNSMSDCERSDAEGDSEDFLDVNSAFVTKVVQHKLRNNANNAVHTKGVSPVNSSKGHASPIKQTSNGTRLVPIPEKNILLGERLAVAGYQCASKEKYDQAIELFTRALRNVPNDHRYWGNRSFCYFQIGAYQK